MLKILEMKISKKYPEKNLKFFCQIERSNFFRECFDVLEIILSEYKINTVCMR